MDAIRRELFEGERIVTYSPLHAVHLLRRVVVLAILAGVGVVAAALSNDKEFQSALLLGAGALLAILVLARVSVRVFGWSGRSVAVTNRRLIEMTGVFTKKVSSFPLADVTEVHVQRSLAGRLFGYGELWIVAASGRHHVWPVPRPENLHRALAAGFRTPRSRFGDAVVHDTDVLEPEPAAVAPGPAQEPQVRQRRALDDRLGNGRYRLVQRIASGGMGTVYEGRDELLRRRVAIKLIREELAGDAALVERFRREARAVASLAHPNIASVFDYGEEDDVPFIVMELVRGNDLAHLLEQSRMLPVPQAVALMCQVLDALQHAHEAEIVHRDIKPANVIVDDNGVVKVTDFGIARAAGSTRITLTGRGLGSAPYASPEQVSGRSVGPESDIYSCGVVLYEMLTGRPPFQGEPLVVARRHVVDEIAPPSLMRRDLPEWLDGVVIRATAKDPARRFSSAREMAAFLVSSPTAPRGVFPEGSATLRLVEPNRVDTRPLPS